MYIVNYLNAKAHQESVSNLVYTETFEQTLSCDTKPITKLSLHCLLPRANLTCLCTLPQITLQGCHKLVKNYIIAGNTSYNFGEKKMFVQKLFIRLQYENGPKACLKYLSTKIAIPQFMTRGVNYSKQFQSICF